MRWVRNKALFTLLFLCQGGACSSAPVAFGGLDSNGDGLLGAVDLQPGEAAVYLRRSRPGPSGQEISYEAHSSQSASIWYNPNLGNWALRVPLQGAPEYVLAVGFDDISGPRELSPGTTDVLGVSLDVPAREHGGVGVPFGTVTVLEVSGAAASGQVDIPDESPWDIIVESYVQLVPTGEEVRVTGVAFAGVEVEP